MKNILRYLGLALGAAMFTAGALAQTVVLDQQPAPGLTQSTSTESVLQSYAVSGGTMYTTVVNQQKYAPGNGQPAGVAMVFVPTGSSGTLARPFNLSQGVSDTGIAMTATPTGGAFGITRTTGTSFVLTGESTSASSKTDKVAWEFNVPTTYVASSVLPVTINAAYAGAGTVTVSTLAVAAYTEVNGVETAITGITAAQTITNANANYVFNIPITAALVPGQHIVIELTTVITTSSGAANAVLNTVSITG